MDHGRPLVDGAAFFWTLPTRRDGGLVRLLVALQTLLNLMDHALERDARETGGRPGAWTMLLSQALDLTRPPPRAVDPAMFKKDQGLVHELVAVCRASCAGLPGYRQGRPLIVRETERAVSFEIEHDPCDRRRLTEMNAYAARHFPGHTELAPWELVGGASSLMTAMVVLALSVDDAPADELADAVHAYVWVGSTGALLDSYGDYLSDSATGAHNWFSYYAERSEAIERTATLLRETLRQMRALPHAERHVLLVVCMAALALSSDAARGEAMKTSTDWLAGNSGTTTRLLVPILRMWRVAYGQASD